MTTIDFADEELQGMTVLGTFKAILKIAHDLPDFEEAEFVFDGKNGSEFSVIVKRIV